MKKRLNADKSRIISSIYSNYQKIIYSINESSADKDDIVHGLEGIFSVVKSTEELYIFDLEKLNTINSMIQMLKTPKNIYAIDVIYQRLSKLINDSDASLESETIVAREKLFNTEIDISICIGNINDMNKQIRYIVDSCIEKDIKNNRPSYYSKLQKKVEAISQKISEEQIKLNTLYIEADKNNLVLHEAKYRDVLEKYKELKTANIKDIIDGRINSINFKNDLLTENINLLLNEQSNDGRFNLLDDLITKTKIYRAYLKSSSEEEFAINLKNEFKTDKEIIGALSELIKSLKDVEKLNDPSNRENLKNIIKSGEEIYEEIYNEAYLLSVECGNILEQVKHYLNVVPKDFQSASLKIRSCIENYIRYVKHYDLNSTILFEGKNNYQKFHMVGLPEEICDEVAEMYTKQNIYVHNNVEQISLNKEDKEKELIKFSKRLHDLKFDEYDPVEGLREFFKAQDKLLVNELKKFNRSGDFIKFCNRKYIKKGQISRYSFMVTNKIDIPSVAFNYKSYSAFDNSVKRYFQKHSKK